MSKQKLRKLVIDGKRYLWRIELDYLGDPKRDLFARVTCVAYLDGHKNSSGRISFVTRADAQAGAPLISGYAVALDSGSVVQVNLNEPKYAACVVRLLLRLGWDPKAACAFRVENATNYLPGLLAETATGSQDVT